MKCTQKSQLTSFPKVRVLKKWFRHFNDHREFRNDGTLHLFSLMALYSYANFRSNTKTVNGWRFSITPGHTPEATVGTALTKYDIISGRIVNNGVYVAEEEVASEPVLMYNNHNQNLHNAQYSHLRVLFCFDAAFLTLIGTLTTIKPADTQ